MGKSRIDFFIIVIQIVTGLLLLAVGAGVLAIITLIVFEVAWHVGLI